MVNTICDQIGCIYKLRKTQQKDGKQHVRFVLYKKGYLVAIIEGTLRESMGEVTYHAHVYMHNDDVNVEVVDNAIDRVMAHHTGFIRVTEKKKVSHDLLQSVRRAKMIIP